MCVGRFILRFRFCSSLKNQKAVSAQLKHDIRIGFGIVGVGVGFFFFNKYFLYSSSLTKVCPETAVDLRPSPTQTRQSCEQEGGCGC